MYYGIRRSILVNVNLIKENTFRFIFHFKSLLWFYSLSKSYSLIGHWIDGKTDVQKFYGLTEKKKKNLLQMNWENVR